MIHALCDWPWQSEAWVDRARYCQRDGEEREVDAAVKIGGVKYTEEDAIT